MADMSKKTDAELRKIMNKDSGADQKTATAAYKELTKRKGDLGFTVTMILGGRDIEHPKAPPKKPKKKMNKGGYANCGASMKPTQKSSQKMNKGGLAKPNNPGLKKLPTAVRNKMGYMAKGGYAKGK